MSDELGRMSMEKACEHLRQIFEPANDPVSAPDHYAGPIECKDAMKAMVDGVKLAPMVIYWWLSIFKYIWRWPRKGGVDDLFKARQCIDFLIAEVD